MHEREISSLDVVSSSISANGYREVHRCAGNGTVLLQFCFSLGKMGILHLEETRVVFGIIFLFLGNEKYLLNLVHITNN